MRRHAYMRLMLLFERSLAKGVLCWSLELIDAIVSALGHAVREYMQNFTRKCQLRITILPTFNGELQ